MKVGSPLASIYNYSIHQHNSSNSSYSSLQIKYISKFLWFFSMIFPVNLPSYQVFPWMPHIFTMVFPMQKSPAPPSDLRPAAGSAATARRSRSSGGCVSRGSPPPGRSSPRRKGILKRHILGDFGWRTTSPTRWCPPQLCER